MKFKNIRNLNEVQFRRLTGVKPHTFDVMVALVRTHEARLGRPCKLAAEERVLMTLEYLREYRTYAHIAASYGVSESNAYENIRRTENILIKSKEFALPGKKALLKSDNEFEVVLIDATESPIERPKKNSADFIQGRKNDTQSKLKS